MVKRVRALRFGESWVLGRQHHDGRFVWWSTEMNGWVPDAIMDEITVWATEPVALAYLQLNQSRMLAAEIIEHQIEETVTADRSR